VPASTPAVTTTRARVVATQRPAARAKQSVAPKRTPPPSPKPLASAQLKPVQAGGGPAQAERALASAPRVRTTERFTLLTFAGAALGLALVCGALARGWAQR
jgi:hypothetical protein